MVSVDGWSAIRFESCQINYHWPVPLDCQLRKHHTTGIGYAAKRRQHFGGVGVRCEQLQWFAARLQLKDIFPRGEQTPLFASRSMLC